MKNIEKIKKHKDVIFLDTSQKVTSEQKSYLFFDPIKTITAFSQDEVAQALNEINEIAQSKKYWLAGYVTYEAGYSFLPKIFNCDEKSKRPLVWFGVYEDAAELEDEDGFCTNLKQSLQIKKNIDYPKFQEAILKIKDEIKSGNTYQVNFTFDSSIIASGYSDEELYFMLRQAQKTQYSAFIRNEFDTILSFSPELFFKIDKNKITAKPMKGTFSRTNEFISVDEKTKAENLMIVDLLRNDIGKVADKGTVKVESLLDVEIYSTLHQLTSTITGDISCVDYCEIFKALFPCGSVTGAPKIETMKIIKKLEQGERGIYCGALGYISPKGKSVFSVPIRILQKNGKTWTYRVGSGIVWDSKPEAEWEENDLKMAFLKNFN